MDDLTLLAQAEHELSRVIAELDTTSWTSSATARPGPSADSPATPSRTSCSGRAASPAKT